MQNAPGILTPSCFGNPKYVTIRLEAHLVTMSSPSTKGVVSSARANCHCRYTGSLTVIKGSGVPASGSSGIYLAIRIHCDNGCARKKKKCPDTNSTHES